MKIYAFVQRTSSVCVSIAGIAPFAIWHFALGHLMFVLDGYVFVSGSVLLIAFAEVCGVEGCGRTLTVRYCVLDFVLVDD